MNNPFEELEVKKAAYKEKFTKLKKGFKGYLLQEGSEAAQNSLRADYIYGEIDRALDFLDDKGELLPDEDLDTLYDRLIDDFNNQIVTPITPEKKFKLEDYNLE